MLQLFVLVNTKKKNFKVKTLKTRILSTEKKTVDQLSLFIFQHVD